MAQGSAAARLDAFVDAAFAFAVTLLVIGGGAVPSSYSELAAAVRNTPAFAVGFALIAMFWHAHVRWRGYGYPGGALPVLLSLVIVFLILCYVYPLRLMAMALVEFVARDMHTIRTLDEGRNLFMLYGVGFMAMGTAIVCLFLTSLRLELSPEARRGVTGEIGIWTILAASGLISALLTTVAPAIAPWTYALLPVVIPSFVRWHWRERGEPPLPARREGPGVGASPEM